MLRVGDSRGDFERRDDLARGGWGKEGKRESEEERERESDGINPKERGK